MMTDGISFSEAIAQHSAPAITGGSTLQNLTLHRRCTLKRLRDTDLSLNLEGEVARP